MGGKAGKTWRSRNRVQSARQKFGVASGGGFVMSRIVPALLVLVMVLSMVVVYVRHQHRMVFADIQKSESYFAELSRQEKRLVLEQQSWLEFWRVENTAKKKLGMVKPDPVEVRIIKLRDR
ncbi:MAG: cell division protein FtsL [Gammaproteobacteria bacterium]|nr:MAG: cell division protein FtsL [Gammaproteobacteria bacterium]